MRTFLKYLLVVGFITLGLTSCVPNKRVVYFQHTREPKVGEVNNADTTSRRYTTGYQEYIFKPGDIISLRVASITPSEFDFVQKYEEQLGLIRKLNQYEQSNQPGNNSRQRGMAGGGTGQGGNEGVMPAIALDRQQTGFVLDQAGNLELPYIGTAKFSGLTVAQAEDMIKEKLTGYFETPVVRIQLLSFHFTILGEVNEEGRYTIFNPNANIIDAIALAGNMNDFADRSKLKIIRFEGQNAKVFYVNMLKEDLLGEPGFYLRPNDLIIVPPLPARATRKYTLPTYTVALSLITSTLTFILLIASLNNK